MYSKAFSMEICDKTVVENIHCRTDRNLQTKFDYNQVKATAKRFQHRGEQGQLNQIFESCPLLADNSAITSRNLAEFYKLLFAKYFLLKFAHICG